MIELSKYVMAGRAKFTLVDDCSPNCAPRRYTYAVTQDSNNPRRFFVGVLYGPDNTQDYRYMGLFYDDTLKLRVTKASFYPETDHRFLMFERLLTAIRDNAEPQGITLFPSCKCARCGRRLTTPQSIVDGLGPECIRYA